MSVSGLCQICEAKEGRFTCDNCGAFVCEDHYDRTEGLCADCLRLVRGGDEDRPGGRDGPDTADGEDDVGDGDPGPVSD
ncbi:hypothetical protein [Halorarum halobium]|uniref:hypothetical protein n=1 Tax=Halorarum halobium TaxID=3075121 RepID=UPI0028A8A318|nr:hypothetical protein [Halobaculum sp. XH14]